MIDKVHVGDIIEFRRTGFVARVLGNLLKLFEPSWDAWGWHLAIVWDKGVRGWRLLEATGEGVKLQYHTSLELEVEAKNYHWLLKTPSDEQRTQFLAKYLDKRYDVAIYLWTALQYLIRHYYNRRIPRLLDDRWSCWELVWEWADFGGRPIGSDYDCPMIMDFHKALDSLSVAEQVATQG